MICVESFAGFGDCCFNIPLILALSNNNSVTVATSKHCRDAFINIKQIDNVIIIPKLGDSNNLNFKNVYQITQLVHFYRFKKQDQNHSLIDTPLWVGREIGLTDFNQRPIFIPTKEEITTTDKLTSTNTIAIESIYNSKQSWATDKHIYDIIINHLDYKIVWLSNIQPPNFDNIVDTSNFTRRELIASLRHCKTLYSVGSGFFCAALALPFEFQPDRIVCLWVDDLYKYERRMSSFNWHKKLIWVHNLDELRQQYG